MSNEQHKARLKHAAEVLGWLADGKTLQGRRPVVGADWENLTPDEEENWNEPGAVGAILAGFWEYRVKPEPVEYEGVAVPYTRPGDGKWMTQVVLDTQLSMGTKVKITVLES